VRVGLSVPNFAEPHRLLEVARVVDENGWDGFFLWDHVVVDRAAPPPISEPWTVLAAVATATSRVRIGTMVTPVARRRPWVLARQVLTVDHLSGGRAVLGVGLGVPPELEYGAVGEPADPKVHAELLDEALEVITGLWSGDPVDHRGRNFTVADVRFLPPPVQQPRVPIWSAASLPARGGVRRAARWDGVVPMHATIDELRPCTPEEVATIVREIRGAREGDGPFDVVVWVVFTDESLRREYADAGATWLVEGPAPGPDWLDDAFHMARSGPFRG
jgi:alkanesulfonate monooxygenase SsuD/methylene tetrahydromethanopterin reductase-like flavin-dependent oxidoreductase (luciferase family)